MHKQWLYALILGVFLIAPGSARADLSLPQTPCDDIFLNGPHPFRIHMTNDMTMENGSTAFSYGTGNGPFVSTVDGFLLMRLELLFQAPSAVIRLVGLGEGCGPVLGFGFAFSQFSQVNLQDENIVRYNPATGQYGINDGELSISRAQGIPRYIWIEAWDGIPGSSFATFSYLIDIQNPQNPILVNPTPPPEPQPQPQGKRPVLIVPGIAGSDLFNNGEFIWPDVFRMVFDNNDQFITQHLSLDENGNSVQEIKPGDIVKILEVNLALFKYRLDVFDGLISDLINSGYKEDESLFFFPYDWRLDLNQSNSLLNEKIEAIKTLTGFQKIDIIAHSTGGILTKNYIDQHGKDSINKLIFVGVPHLGAPKAAKVVLKGDNFGIPFLDPDPIQEIAVNSPALHQLLPNQNYFQNFSGYISPYSLGRRQLLDYDETKDFMIDRGDNQYLQNNLESFFAKNLQDVDLIGIDVYNISGCKTATQAAYRYGIDNLFISSVGYSSGDETVPLISADYINTPNKYYVKSPKHSELPSWDGVRELIAGILSGNPQLAGNIRQDQSFCGFKGKTLTWRSPVAVHIYDSAGNHSGPIQGGLENNILGVDYEILDGEKFIFLPTDEGQIYRIEGFGEATGTFDLLISENDNGTVTETKVYNDVAINDRSKINLEISETSTDDSIILDRNGNGQTETILMQAVLDQTQSEDLVAPATTATILGTEGNNGWLKSDASITLEGVDDNSGVLETRFSTDGINFNLYQNAISLQQEGATNVLYYSVDRAGNNEEIKTLEIKIDKTSPEFSSEFDPVNKEFVFKSIDNLDNSPKLDCSVSECTAIDEAGNIAKLKFKINEGKTHYKLDLQTINYNDSDTIDLRDNSFIVEFREKRDILKDFDQVVVIKKQERARINYKKRSNQSIVTQKIKGEQKTKEIFSGFKFLRLTTAQGNLNINIK